MARSEQVLSIFLASPSDLVEERSRLADVIRDWNRTWSREFGVRLELLCWEENAFPDIGDDAQDVINRQIPSDWDLFIGVMWSRFGTPTSRAGSGTEEEFNRAVIRYHDVTASVSLLFYFKDAPIAPSKIITSQLEKVQNFKKEVQSKGLLTWDFSDVDQFEKLVDLHITRHVQEWRKLRAQTTPLSSGPSTAIPPIAAPQPSLSQEEKERDDDDGYLDLLETFTERSAEMMLVVLRITEAQQALTAKSETGRLELEQIRVNPSNDAAKRIKASIARVSQEMLSFTDRVEEEVPLLRAAIDGGFSTLVRIATISVEIYPDQLEDAKSATFILLNGLITARQATERFRKSTSELPRMTKDLNFAKKKQVAALESFIGELKNGEKLLSEALAAIDDLCRTGTSDRGLNFSS